MYLYNLVHSEEQEHEESAFLSLYRNRRSLAPLGITTKTLRLSSVHLSMRWFYKRPLPMAKCSNQIDRKTAE